MNAYFRSPDSPLAPEAREAFTGIDFFPPNPEFRFVVKPDTRRAGGRVSYPDTKDNLRQYTVHSHLHLKHRDTAFTLTVYQSDSGGGNLFLPFTDLTTGEETYPVGRYLELRRGPDDALIVDFNYATTPFCAYNDDFACPLVPPENHVPVAVTAGEKHVPARP